MRDVTARAISGAGSTSEVGVAGAFAQNVSVALPMSPLVIPTPTLPTPPAGLTSGTPPTLPPLVIPGPAGSRHHAAIFGSANINIENGGDLRVESYFAGDYVAEAVPEDEQTALYGVGASVALNAINHSTLAEIRPAIISGADDIFVLSIGDFETAASASAGAKGAANLPAAIAMNYTDARTISDIHDGAAAGEITGRLLVQANHVADMDHDTDTESGVGTASVGAAISMGMARGGARASSGLSADVADNVWVLSNNSSHMDALAVSGQQGAQADPVNVIVTEETERQAEALLTAAGLGEVPDEVVRVLEIASAETADGSVGVAAAVAANIDFGTSTAMINGGTLIVPEAPLVRATGDMDADAFADASSVDGNLVEISAALGVAVAINGDGQRIESSLGGNITAPNFNLHTTFSGDGVSNFDAQAVSGAGGRSVGVAGAFAINASDPKRGAKTYRPNRR